MQVVEIQPGHQNAPLYIKSKQTVHLLPQESVDISCGLKTMSEAEGKTPNNMQGTLD